MIALIWRKICHELALLTKVNVHDLQLICILNFIVHIFKIWIFIFFLFFGFNEFFPITIYQIFTGTCFALIFQFFISKSSTNYSRYSLNKN